MLLSFKWIKDFVDIDENPYKVADALTMSGIEVEDVVHVSIPGEVVCVRVVDVMPHPNADRLSIARVDTGREKLDIVCGAPNVRPGMLSALAPPGVVLADGMKVKRAKIRGVESPGILVSERELGLTDDHTGIMEGIPDGIRPGESLVQAMDLEDWVFNINVTPNRGDCLSVIGIARELSTMFGTEMTWPSMELKETGAPIESMLKVEVDAVEACPRYCARMLEGAAISKSPFYMRRRLFLSGIRAINNVVDVTNYVMLEYGQPLHAFDYERIGGHTIIVRKALEGENFVTLDSVERALGTGDLLICDKDKPVALAGIMGGENSEITEESKTVVIESAYFEPIGIRKTSSRLNLSTEASYRFERGIDPLVQRHAADRAAYLMADLTGARILQGAIDVDNVDKTPREIFLRKARLEKVLGVGPVKPSRVVSILEGLGCRVSGEKGTWKVYPPKHRHDLEREIDLIEEYIRIEGMDKVESSLPCFSPDVRKKVDTRYRKLRDTMASMGFSEAITYSFISPAWKKWFPGKWLELSNPISEEMRLMRTSLVPGIAGVVARNKHLQVRDVFVFEMGRCFIPGDDGTMLPEEVERLAIAVSGLRRPRHWSEEESLVDFYDIKGIAETLIPGIVFRESSHAFLEAGQQADLVLNDNKIGHLGSLAREIREYLDVDDEVYVMEVDIDPMLERAPVKMKPVPRFPSTWRDISLVAKDGIAYKDIEDVILASGIREIRGVQVIDVYKGEKLPAGKRGITVRITYQSDKTTLDDKKINKWQSRILEKLGKDLGVQLRGN